MKRLFLVWKKIDLALFLALLLLMALSLSILISIEEALFYKQLIRFAGAWFLFFLILLIPAKNLRKITPWLYFLTIFLLLAVLIFGVKAGGAQRWINLGFFRLQPSEIAKIIVPMMVAWYSSLFTHNLSVQNIITNLLIIFVPAILIFKEPDLGTTLLVSASGFIALFLAGLSKRFIVRSLALLAIILPLFWKYGIKEYQRDRVITFLNPEADPWGNGYHIIQSKIAIGSGGFYGKGYHQGTQSHLEFLPESSTDFIFSVWSEEFGFLGVCALLIIYAFIIYRGLFLAKRLNHSFARIVVATTFLSFFINIFVNIGMVSGILPVVGLPLALVSYGGSSILSLLIGFGIAVNLSHYYRNSQQSGYY